MSDVESGIDELYRLPLDQFTAKRNELAAALKKGGDREAAERVKALAKPGVAAWAVNQVWWRNRAAFDEMLAAGDALRRAHSAFAQGKTGGVRAEVEARERTVNAVTDAAVAVLGGPAKVGHDLRHRIAGTLESFASSGVPADVTLGRLSGDLQLSGLEALSAMAGLAPPAAPAPIAAPAPPRPTLVHSAGPPKSKAEEKVEKEQAKAELAAREQEQRLAQARARVEAGEAALESATADASQAADEEEAARTALEKASARVTELEQQLESAHEDARTARRTLSKATQAASEAEMHRVRSARDLEKAKAALEPT